MHIRLFVDHTAYSPEEYGGDWETVGEEVRNENRFASRPSCRSH